MVILTNNFFYVSAQEAALDLGWKTSGSTTTGLMTTPLRHLVYFLLATFSRHLANLF